MISKLFKKIQKKPTYFLKANSGKEFEQRIEVMINDELGYTRLLPDDIPKKRFEFIKKEILHKKKTDFLDVEKIEEKKYIKQPFGSQQYPDLIIFTKRKIIPIEIKYSNKKQTYPMWNSNLPKDNGFYIFGSYDMKDVTFFCGKDVLSKEKRAKMIDFFPKMKVYEKEFNKKLSEINEPYNRGFTVYIRIAYEQKKIEKSNNIQKNFFTHKQRKETEEKLIKYIEELQEKHE